MFCQSTYKYLTNGDFIIISTVETSSSHVFFNVLDLQCPSSTLDYLLAPSNILKG